MFRVALSFTLRSLPPAVALVASSSPAWGSSSSDCASGESKNCPSGPWTLRYFPVPGTPGEIVRLLLVLSGEEWKDMITGGKTKPSWSQLKPTAKFGQLPILISSNGTEMTQSRAISRFLAPKVTLNAKSLRPADDAWLCFQSDELVDALEDVRGKIVFTFGIKDQAEKEAARKALFAKGGAMYNGFRKIDALVGKNGSSKGHMVGDSFSVADLWAFVLFNQFRAGFLDGVPTNGWIDDMPELRAVVENVAAIPAVRAYYAEKAKGNRVFAAFVAEK